MGKRGKRQNPKIWDVIAPEPKKTVAYVVAYGSLMNQKSLKGTIGKEFTGLTVVKISGLRRTWIASSRNNPNFQKFWVRDVGGEEVVPIFKPCYLDVTIDRDSELVAPIFPVNVDDIKELDLREAGYMRVEVTDFVKNADDSLYTDTKPIFIYMGRPEYRLRVLDNEAQIPFPYVAMCATASKTYGEACYDNFMQHIEGVKIKVMENIKLGDNQEY